MYQYNEDETIIMFYLLKTRIDDCIRNNLDLDNIVESIYNAYFDGELTSSQYDTLISKIG